MTRARPLTLARLRWCVRHLAYPVLLLGPVLVTGASFARPELPTGLAVAAALVSAAALIALCERIAPASPGRRPARGVIRSDLLHSLLSSFVTSAAISAAVTALGVAAGVATAGWLAERVGVRLWPATCPLALQLVFGLVLGELGAYAGHRACHASERMWRIHAMHHSADHLYVLAAGRNHPLNVLWTYCLQTFPLVLLGAPPELLALHGAFTGAQGLLQHSDARFEARWLEWLLATPRLHRIHHGHEPADGDTNLGNNLIVWDLVFGTRRLDPEPETFGLAEGFPQGFLAQLASPWRD
ncbi:MAG: sterol desaturase family protein [Planctomycetota bacterium]